MPNPTAPVTARLELIETISERQHHPFSGGLEIHLFELPSLGEAFTFVEGYTTTVKSLKYEGDSIFFRTCNSTYQLTLL